MVRHFVQKIDQAALRWTERSNGIAKHAPEDLYFALFDVATIRFLNHGRHSTRWFAAIEGSGECGDGIQVIGRRDKLSPSLCPILYSSEIHRGRKEGVVMTVLSWSLLGDFGNGKEKVICQDIEERRNTCGARSEIFLDSTFLRSCFLLRTCFLSPHHPQTLATASCPIRDRLATEDGGNRH